jgi:hypothetical protein
MGPLDRRVWMHPNGPNSVSFIIFCHLMSEESQATERCFKTNNRTRLSGCVCVCVCVCVYAARVMTSDSLKHVFKEYDDGQSPNVKRPVTRWSYATFK